MLMMGVQIERCEQRMDAKIELLQQTYQSRRSSNDRAATEEPSFVEEPSVMSVMMEHGTTATNDESLHGSESSEVIQKSQRLASTDIPLQQNSSSSSSERSDNEDPPSSPLANKSRFKARRAIIESSDSEYEESPAIGPDPIRADTVEHEHEHDVSTSSSTSSSTRSSESGQSQSDFSPSKVDTNTKTAPRATRARSKQLSASTSTMPAASSSGNLADFEELEQDMEELSLRSSMNDSIIILPNKNARKKATQLGGAEVDYVPKDGEVDTAPKKKR